MSATESRPTAPAADATPWFPHAAADALRVAIATARDVDTLAHCADQSRQLAQTLHAGHGSAAQITRLLTCTNDAIVRRLLALLAPSARLPPTAWCWLAFGSQGRGEQTLVTDQDNGLLFAAGDAAEARLLRAHLLPFAERVNAALAECGYSLCSGDIMAGKARCCLSLGEWQEAFTHWMRTPEPEALLNASIFFDFRAIAGDTGLTFPLRQHLAAVAARSPLFLRLMSENALLASPPLGRLRDFTDDGGNDGCIDLKKSAARIFVDVARIIALAAGIDACATSARLRQAAETGALATGDAAAASAAFHAVQQLRLGSQIGHAQSHRAIGNRLAPDSLNSFDRRVLIAALRQAQTLQQSLKMRFIPDA